MKTILVLTLLLAVPSFSQTQNRNQRIPVAINATADQIGQSFVYKLKEQLSRSAVFAYSADNKQGFVLNIVAMDGEGGRSFTAVATTLTVNGSDGNFFLDQWVQLVGNSAIDAAVQKLLAGLSGDMDMFQKMSQETPEQQPAIRSY